MKTTTQRLLVGLAATLVLAVVIVAAVVHQRHYLITAQVLHVINREFVGTLLVRDSRISLFKEFPYLALDVQGVRFFASRDTTTRPLYALDDVFVGFHLLELLQGIYRVKSLSIEGGHADVVKFPDGTFNVLLAKNAYYLPSCQQQ